MPFSQSSVSERYFSPLFLYTYRTQGKHDVPIPAPYISGKLEYLRVSVPALYEHDRDADGYVFASAMP